VTPPRTLQQDPRVGQLVREEPDRETRVTFLGFPSDEGVRRNGGRIGAAAGPRALRESLWRLTPDARNPAVHRALLERCWDRGDLEVTGDLERDQEMLGLAVAEELQAGRRPIVLGGGHETTFGHFLGYVHAGRDVHLLNWDAHADVRPPIEGRGHSGSPFRQAIEHSSGRCRSYTVAGLLPWSVADEHLEFVDAQGGVVLFRQELTETRIDALFAAVPPTRLVSFDLDAVEAASAPGVSAPGVGGLPPSLWLHAAWRAGREGSASCDVVELNPTYDRDGRTSRLAALTVWHFLAGLAWAERTVPESGHDPEP
jgi:formiminoglutamase